MQQPKEGAQRNMDTPMIPKQRTILIIDPTQSVYELLQSQLTNEGYKAIAALTLDHAIWLLSTEKVDLVIANYMESIYQRGDCWPVLEMLKNIGEPGTRFIATTSTKSGLTQSAQQLAIADLIEKPFEIGDVLERVARVIGERQP